VRPNADPKAERLASVQDYPRRPIIEPASERVRVLLGGVAVADSGRSLRVLQRGFPPVYYLPPDDVRLTLLERSDHHSACRIKGQADYWTVRVGERIARNAAWSYPDSPSDVTPPGYYAFYAHLFDLCTLDGKPAEAPPYSWLGGWVSEGVEGPFWTVEEVASMREG
jgi:uncharacterized protein (DUF427 family)